MPPDQNIQPETQDGKSIEHPIVSLILGKTVLPHRGRGNPAVSTSSSASPLLIGGKNVLPHQGRGNHQCFGLIIDIAVVDRVDVDKFVKRNTKAGCRETLYFKPLVNVVGGIDKATIIKKIIAYVLHPPNEWLEIIHVDRRQEKA